MKRLILILTLIISVNTQAGGLPVYDGSRHITDLIDNIQDIIDQVNQIKNQMEQIENQVEQIEQLSEQIEQMDDYLDRVGHAAKVGVKVNELLTKDIKDILDEIYEYTGGEGLTEAEKKQNTELYGDINKEDHTTVNEPEPEKKYEKHERVEKEYAAYKKTSDSISLKRMALLDELERLSGLLNAAGTDQEVQKINSSINAHKLMLSALKDEEERQYRSYQAEIRRNENIQAKERTRYEERTKFNDVLNRTKDAVYKLKKSREILNLIEGNGK